MIEGGFIRCCRLRIVTLVRVKDNISVSYGYGRSGDGYYHNHNIGLIFSQDAEIKIDNRPF